MHPHIEAVIFDWAGTIVDFGSFAPTQIFVDAFKQAFDFELSLAEARGPMGLGKWQHIEALGNDPVIGARWQAQFGQPMRHADIDHIYQTFLPLQVERVGAHADLIPGAQATVDDLRSRGVKIGSTTGYPRQVMTKLIAAAATRGYSPDCTLCADEPEAGARPGPWMALQCVLVLKINSVAHCVKVDDTLPGIAEGINAGMWTVGVALSGSPAGLTLAEYRGASAERLEAIRSRVSSEFKAAGAHYVIDSVADLLPVLEDINSRLKLGERP
jgi:phosphonoacetaldehyde hydrolase